MKKDEIYNATSICYGHSWWAPFEKEQKDYSTNSNPLLIKRAKELEAEMSTFRTRHSIPFTVDLKFSTKWYLFLPWMYKVLQDFESWIDAAKFIGDDIETEKDQPSLINIRAFPILPQSDFSAKYI